MMGAVPACAGRLIGGEIPAYAGMTELGAGTMGAGAGMTEEGEARR